MYIQKIARRIWLRHHLAKKGIMRPSGDFPCHRFLLISLLAAQYLLAERTCQECVSILEACS
ncbi:hypothetical protein [Pseudocitrobacter corydidari]|uniref:Uncharacterized protein n=1 Tax=Pseudocitrobacter corydidari TaxID=2891570 RepID=A0ABY3S8A2_9ENTR|nr:hypothetical protein [Pseudocitrobacter corydidari]UGS42172.1 hypothetical protein G163CM_28970 [Pseudocitrobacter corydidari]